MVFLLSFALLHGISCEKEAVCLSCGGSLVCTKTQTKMKKKEEKKRRVWPNPRRRSGERAQGALLLFYFPSHDDRLAYFSNLQYKRRARSLLFFSFLLLSHSASFIISFSFASFFAPPRPSLFPTTSILSPSFF